MLSPIGFGRQLGLIEETSHQSFFIEMMQEEQEGIVDDGQLVFGFWWDDVQYPGAV